MKTTDFPSPLRPMAKVMIDLAYHHHPAEVYRDFLDYLICTLLPHGDEKVRGELQERYRDRYKLFIDLYYELITLMADQLTVEQWVDPLGTIYEVVAGHGKKSWMGQFFTPPEVCDMLAMMQVPEGVTGQRIMDPACGSGRTLLAAHVRSMGNTLYGVDLDPMCAKMATFNLAIHGCQGFITCGDSLGMDFNWCYHVNPWPNMMAGIPHIVAVDPRIANFEPRQVTPALPEVKQVPAGGQLKLF